MAKVFHFQCTMIFYIESLTSFAINWKSSISDFQNENLYFYVRVKTVHACPQTSKLLSEASDLRNETLMKLQKNFQIFPETFISEFGLFFKFGVITWFTKQITKFAERKFQGTFEKFYEVQDWSFKVSILSFILNFEVSDKSFEVKGTLELF